MIPDVDPANISKQALAPKPKRACVPFLDVYAGKRSRYNPHFTGKENQRLNKCPTNADLKEEMRKCGRNNCQCRQPGGKKHGPYLYAVWFDGRKQFKRYIGKVRMSARDQLDLEIRTLAKHIINKSAVC
jgi:hypothetical protein